MFASLGVGLHPRRRAGQPAGHQRPLPRQPPARRHLLGGPPGPRRRDHARRSSSSIGEVARDFDLYTKITGGQRIDLLGARVEQLPGDLGPARRRRPRVGPRLRQGGAHREVVRRLDVVPLRRAGLGAAGHRPRAALPGPARAAQDQARRVGLRPRVRRGPEQGRRRHRHRAGLEPLRRRQRRHAPGPRRAARRGPRRPRRSCATIDRYLMWYVRTADRLERTAHVAAQAATAASTSSAGSSSTTRSASAPSSRPTWPATSSAYQCEWTATLDDPERLARFAIVRQHRRARPDRSPTCEIRGQRMPGGERPT